MDKKTEMSKRFKLLETLMQQGYTSEKELGKLDTETLMAMFPQKMEDFKRGYTLVKAAKEGKIVAFLSVSYDTDIAGGGTPV